jgi:hydroxymethylbilane synthase
LRLGTRGSTLALAQTRIVADALGASVETRVIRTTGDASSRPLQELGDGVFVTAIEDALRAGEIDAAVHSLKDLPTGDRPGLVVAAILAREDPRDVLVTSARGGLATLPHGARVGTSSPRRDAALRLLRPDITTAHIRGNVETRLAKVMRGEFDATVLALAGLRRLSVAVDDDEILSAEQMLPSPGQGAIAVQCRTDDTATRDRLTSVDDAPTRACTDAERELLRLMGGSCELALGAVAMLAGGDVVLDASIDGRRVHVRSRDPMAAARSAAAELGALDAV